MEPGVERFIFPAPTNMTEKQYKILVKIYQVFRSARYQFLHSAFGYVSHCKHTPTCGTYALKAMREEGWLLGGAKGILRVLRCW